MIRVDGLGHRYGEKTSLRDVSFGLDAGEKLVLLGSNGCGKSTLLKILNGLIAPSEGEVRYEGERVTPARVRTGPLRSRFRKEVALLFQSPDVMLFNPTVYDEIAFGPRQFGMADIDARVQHWSRTMRVGHLLERPPFTLSGGEKQKVALAALLANEPRLLLLDEPAAALDPRATGWLVDFLADLSIATVTTTHNLSLAPEFGTRALVLDEAHGLIHDGDIEPFLANTEALLRANLVHTHTHRHGDIAHRHPHAHDWS